MDTYFGTPLKGIVDTYTGIEGIFDKQKFYSYEKTNGWLEIVEIKQERKAKESKNHGNSSRKHNLQSLQTTQKAMVWNTLVQELKVINTPS